MRLIPIAVATTLLAAPAFADCKADLQATFDEMKAAGPYQVEMTTIGGGNTLKANAKILPPDRFHVQSDQMEMILIKKKAWMKVGGNWQPMPGQAAAMMGNMIETGMRQGVEGVTNIKCLGKKTFEGEAYDAFTYDATGEAMGVSSTARVTLYKGDGPMPQWIVVDGKAMGVTSKTVQKITPDPSIKINPPQ